MSAQAQGRMQQHEVLGVRLAVTREGAGLPIVCLHAVGHGAADFDAFAQQFRDEFEIIRVDWPGHGASGPDLVAPSGQRYGELLEALLLQLGVREPILLGNSIGGAAALLYAARHPVRAIVLCDSAGLVAVDRVVRAACALFVAFFARGAAGAAWFRWAFGLYYRMVLPALPARTRREQIVAEGPRLAPLLRDAWRSFGRAEADLRPTLWSLRVPIWFAWARHDRVIPFASVRAAIQRAQAAQVTLFDAGHAAFLERPQEFAQGFARFVSERLGLPHPGRPLSQVPH